jgi:branched-chain amino acid transport system ATP-binding protein
MNRLRCSQSRGCALAFRLAGTGRRDPVPPSPPTSQRQPWQADEKSPSAAVPGDLFVLVVEDLHVYYGEIHALKGVSLIVGDGEIVALLGPNGAGKTTTVKTISGLLVPRHGRVTLEDAPLTGYPPHEIVYKGVAHVPEGRKIFNRLTVAENLEMGAYSRADGGVGEDLERVFHLFPRLKERLTQVAGTLSGGEQQMLAIGRAMMARPRVLLLDEPSMGLAPVVVEQIFETIVDINRRGTTILLVEQNAAMALGIARRGYVLETGVIALAGTAAELANNADVRRAYLGE